MGARETSFAVTGGFEVAEGATPQFGAGGGVAGFVLPTGEVVRLVVALEVEDRAGLGFRYVTSEDEMAALGFGGLAYSAAEFGGSG